MKYFSILLSLITVIICTLLLPAETSANTKLVIYDYTSTISLSQKNIVRLKKGDNLDYKHPKYDDSSWIITSFPSNWNTIFPHWKGICWYRIHITFPKHKPVHSLGIRLGVIKDVDEVYFNGNLIGRSGKFPPNKESAYDKKRIYELPSSLIKPGKGNVLAIRIAGMFPDVNGPYKGTFEIGAFYALQKKMLSREFIDVFFVIIYLVSSFVFALFYFLRSIQKEYIFFSLFLFSMSIYFFFRTQVKYFLTEDFLFLKRFEYITLFIAIFLFMEFITYYFRKKHNLFHFIFYSETIIAILLIIFTNNYDFWHDVLHFMIQPAWIIPSVFFIDIVIKNFNKDINVKYLLTVLIVIFLTMVNDIMVQRAIYDFPRLSNYSFILLIIFSALMMRNRHLELQLEVEDLRIKKKKHISITDYSSEKVSEAIAIISDSYNSDISRESIAADLKINPDHLGKIFKKQTGKTINDHINEMRIQDAAKKIVQTDHSIIDIAFSVGFESMSTFYRVFHKTMGVSPSRYKNQNPQRTM